MKVTFLLGLLASTSLASARIYPGTHALAVAASLVSGPMPAFAKPVWRYTSTRLSPRHANSTTSAAAGTYTVASGDTLNAIAATEGISTQQLEDANPGVVPTDLQVGQVLNLPSSASSNGTSSATNGTSTSDNAPAAMQSNSVDASDLGDGLATGSSAAAAGTTPQNTTSGCGGHHHHHRNSTSTAGSGAQGQNGTIHARHHSHNGTTTDNAHNSTSVTTGSGECNATSHHHQNGTGGTTTAASFFVPATATASALAVALTSSAATGDVEARALGGFAATLHRARWQEFRDLDR